MQPRGWKRERKEGWKRVLEGNRRAREIGIEIGSKRGREGISDRGIEAGK